jgi:UDP-N-acetylglucosamine 4,6-dehydratase
LGNYYSVPPDLRDLNYNKFMDQGEVKISVSDDYNSHNTERLDISSMKKLLLKLEFIQKTTQGEFIDPDE